MLSRSCFNPLNFDDCSTCGDGAWVPAVASGPAIAPDFESPESDAFSSASVERRIIVANRLPLRVRKEGGKWCFDWDKNALVLQSRDGFSPDVGVVYVGCLGVEIEPSEQEEVSQLLLDKFQCIPTFLPLDLIDKFYHGFCKHYLWSLFHYMLPLAHDHGAMFDKATWQAYVSANKIFADKVMEVINPDEDYVWVHDYHLMVLPTFLRKRYHRVKLGFFLHCPFPSSEIYRTMPVREEVLRGLLNCDLIGFQTFDYARHFLSCCSRMLGLDYRSKRGYIGLDYFGRTVSIKILPVGIHLGEIQSLMALPETVNKVKELKRRYGGKIVLLGVDDVDLFKGIGLKFQAFELLLDENPAYRGKVVLVQIMNTPRSRGKDIQEVQNEINLLVSEINKRYGEPGYQPIVCIDGPVSFQDKVAYYAISECVVVNAIRDGMNLVPYKYTVSREGSPELNKALGLEDSATPAKSVIIVSEFVGCSPSLSGAIRVNPWNVNSVTEAMLAGITMSDSEKRLRHEKHYKYVSSHGVAYWARSFDQDLARACSEHFRKRFWGIGFGLKSRVVALGPNFRKLSLEHIVAAYKSSKTRLVLLDYDGTVMPQDRVDKSPSPEVVSLLNGLCADPRNSVFIVSGRGKDSLSKWFSQCERLGLSAEHGYFTRWTKNSEWETCGLAVELDWKEVTLPVLEHYTQSTDGSSIEQKESALVWHHGEADPDFGSWQAKELLDHLESVLANDPVVVTSGQKIVEVKPQGVSKGVVVKNLIETTVNGKRADFVLCIGDDRSDEDMFEVISHSVATGSLPDTAAVFACTVGQKPSMAKYYVEDTFEVIKMLQGLAAASAQQLPRSPSIG